MPTVWTIGYERLLPPQLVAELAAARVERVLDVRFRPQSRRPGMSKTRLGHLLEAQQRGPRTVLDVVGQLVERLRRVGLDVRAVTRPRLRDPARVEVVAQVRRGAERAPVLVGDAVLGQHRAEPRLGHAGTA